MQLISENTNYVNYLIELSQSGRKSAFFDLCEITLKNVFTTIYRLVADYELSKKITKKTFLIAWENIKNYDNKISFLLWLKDIAINISLIEMPKLPPRKLDNSILKENKIKKLEKLIMNLDYKRRIIFVLHDLEGYSYEEISKYLGNNFIDEIKTLIIETREYLIDEVCE
ncbi:MAG: RNA polymerase sigma factor [Melioribacter sp.]|nr:RNA polymerase sigma factor [Melioribacter sp.]